MFKLRLAFRFLDRAGGAAWRCSREAIRALMGMLDASSSAVGPKTAGGRATAPPSEGAGRLAEEQGRELHEIPAPDGPRVAGSNLTGPTIWKAEGLYRGESKPG